MTIEVKVVKNGGGDIVDHSKPINGHSFTVGWLLNSLRENDTIYQKLHGHRSVKDITAYDISGGKGFVSIVLRCTVTFADSIDDCYTTILKIPGFESFEEANSKSDFDEDLLNDKTREKFIRMHEFECDFYSKLAPIIEAPAPKVYKVEDWIMDKKEGCLHMEDLTLRGKTLSFFENISLTQVKSYIQHLARMHKNILSVDEKIWKGKFLKNQDGFVDFIEFMSQSIEPFLKSCKREEDFKPLLQKYLKMIDSKEYYLYVNKQSYKELEIMPVLAQGDMHPGNIMWAIDENGDFKQELAAIIDWQTMHEGSPMEDLARFLSHCADGVVRRQAEGFAIEYYLECLTKEFGGDSTKVPYTAEQLKKSYDLNFISQGFITVAVVKFFFTAIEDKIPNESIKEAYLDFGVLKALHCMEDVDKLLKNECKEFYEKYGL